MPTDTTPNLYELKGDKLKVTYATTSFTGQPTFTLQQGRKTLTFDEANSDHQIANRESRHSDG